MGDSRCDGWTRRAFGLAAGGLLGALAWATGRDGTEAKKKRKRKRKKRPPAPSACARACGSACSFCFHRAAGSLLCGDGAGGSCDAAASCASDDECSPGQFCLVSSEDPKTGAIAPLCLTPGGHCAQVNVCEA